MFTSAADTTVITDQATGTKSAEQHGPSYQAYNLELYARMSATAIQEGALDRSQDQAHANIGDEDLDED
jgi:hypothetical protein